MTCRTGTVCQLRRRTTPRPPTLDEASALAARMDTEVGTWANLWFGLTSVGFYRTSLALEVGEHGQALHAAKAVHPELLPKRRAVTDPPRRDRPGNDRRPAVSGPPRRWWR
ncbi:MAG: hypothetical protein ACRDSZ_00415 [Pseudonocardiaceae bacterium]